MGMNSAPRRSTGLVPVNQWPVCYRTRYASVHHWEVTLYPGAESAAHFAQTGAVGLGAPLLGKDPVEKFSFQF